MNNKTKDRSNHCVLILIFFALLFVLSGCNLGTVSPIEATSAPIVQTEDERLVVAWTTSGDLMVWQTGDTVPRRIASGGAVQAFISPDGQRIAFTRGPQGKSETLWVVAVNSTGEQQLVGENPANYTPGINQVGDVVWQDHQTIYFNTLQEQAPFYEPRNDLYRMNVVTRQLSQNEFAGDAGRIAITPDGEYIVTAYHGTYGVQDGVIRVHDLLGRNAPYDLLYFDGVSTGSEFRFYPKIFWASDEHVLVALPDPDLVYSALNEQEIEATELWRLSIMNPNEHVLLGTVDASYFGQPIWSPDGGSAMIYFATGEDQNDLIATLAEQDGSNPREIYRGTLGQLDVPQWIPRTSNFVYPDVDSNEGGAHLFIMDGMTIEPQALSDEPIYALQFVSDTQYVYVAQGDGRLEMRAGSIGGESQFIGSLSTLPIFDTVLID